LSITPIESLTPATYPKDRRAGCAMDAVITQILGGWSATANSRARVPWGRWEGAVPGYPAAAARRLNDITQC